MSQEKQRLDLTGLNLMKPNFIEKQEPDFKNQFTMNSLFKNIDFQEQAKDSNGNLHPKYVQPLRKGFQSIRDYVQLYTSDILNSMREIDFLCVKISDRKVQKYQECKKQTNQKIHQKIFIPIANSAALLHKVSNQCMLKGNSVDACSKVIIDHTHFMFKLAAQRIKAMTLPLKQLVPSQFEHVRNLSVNMNNAIIEEKSSSSKIV